MSHTLTLGQKQRLFCSLIAELIRWLYANGYECSFGETYRSAETAAANAAKGIGIANSLHTKRLAIDLNLFINGVYQTTTTAHEPLGAYWESLHPLCRWGGRFTSPDGNHYSIEHEGVK